MLNNLDNICNIFFPQRNTLVEEIHKGIVNLRRIVNTQKKSSAIVSKSDKSTFETKNKNILEFNRTNDKIITGEFQADSIINSCLFRLVNNLSCFNYLYTTDHYV